jgi:hypothetical protein
MELALLMRMITAPIIFGFDPLADASSITPPTNTAWLGAASALLGYNGTTLDLLRSSIANGLQVDVTRVQGTVAVTQSGTWNINNVSGTITLPTGAATEAKQDTQITALQLIDDIVHSLNDSISKFGLVGGHYDETFTQPTEGQTGAFRITKDRALHGGAGKNSIELTALNDTYDTGTTTNTSADIDVEGYTHFSISAKIDSSAGAAGNHTIDFFVEFENINSSFVKYRMPPFGYLRYEDQAFDPVDSFLVEGKIPSGFTTMRVRIVANSLSGTEEFVVSEAEVGLDSQK